MPRKRSWPLLPESTFIVHRGRLVVSWSLTIAWPRAIRAKVPGGEYSKCLQTAAKATLRRSNEFRGESESLKDGQANAAVRGGGTRNRGHRSSSSLNIHILVTASTMPPRSCRTPLSVQVRWLLIRQRAPLLEPRRLDPRAFRSAPAFFQRADRATPRSQSVDMSGLQRRSPRRPPSPRLRSWSPTGRRAKRTHS